MKTGALTLASIFLVLIACDQPQSDDIKALGVETDTIESSDSEIILGRWCDRAVPKMSELWMIIEIVSKGDRTFSRIIQHDGESFETSLIVQGGNAFLIEGSPSGDSYRIVPNDGSLQLIDNDGFIRSASRLENKHTVDECFPA